MNNLRYMPVGTRTVNGKKERIMAPFYPSVKRESYVMTTADTGYTFYTGNATAANRNYTSGGTNCFRSNRGKVLKLVFGFMGPARIVMDTQTTPGDTQDIYDAYNQLISNGDVTIKKNNDVIHEQALSDFLPLGNPVIRGATPFNMAVLQMNQLSGSSLRKGDQMGYEWEPPVDIPSQSTLEVILTFKTTVPALLTTFIIEARLGVLELPQVTNTGTLKAG